MAVATGAQADSMRVTYSLGGTAFVPLIGTVATVAGTMDVSYLGATGGITGGSAGNVLHGGARIVGTGSLGGAFSFNAFGNQVTGTSSGPLSDSGKGALTSGLGNLKLPFAGLLAGTLHCSGIGCTSTLSLPNSIPVPFSIPMVGTLTALSVGAISGLILPSFAFNPASVATFGGLPVILNLVATEISRVYVPEPSTLPLLGMGLVAIGAAGRSLRRRR